MTTETFEEKQQANAIEGWMILEIFGVGAIYAMTPCTKEACLAAVEEIQPRPMTPISIPETKAIAASATEIDPEYEEDDGEDPYEDESDKDDPL